MSEKKDERDIDEILASIDEMLAQKDDKPLDDSRKNSVKDALQASESKLSLSSSADTPQPQSAEQQPFDDIDVDDFIALGLNDEDLEEPIIPEDDIPTTANDTISDNTQDEPEFDEQAANTQHEEEVDEQNEPAIEDTAATEAAPESEVTKDIQDEDEHEDATSKEDDEAASTKADHSEKITRQRILLTEELLEPSAQEALPLWVEQDKEPTTKEITKQEAASIAGSASSSDVSNAAQNIDKNSNGSDDDSDKNNKENNSLNSSDEVELNKDDAAMLSNIAEDLESLPNPSVESTLKPVERRVDDTLEDKQEADAFENVFDDIANDQSITFDVEEDIGVDTVYKLESVNDNTELVEAMLDDVLDEDSNSSEKEKAMPELSALTTPFDDETIKELVQLVSDDIAEQVNEHLETWLPGLIKTSIKKHLNKINNQ